MKKILALLPSLLLAGAVHAADAKLKSGAFDPPRMAPELSLTASDGGDLKLERYRGKVVALGFGFSHCPEICPTTLAKLAKSRKSLGAAGKDFQVVYVTVDPERDSAGQMRAWLANFDPTFVGGTGTRAQLEKVYKAYGVIAEKKGSGVDHSSFVYLIDREGRIRAMAPYGKSAEDIAHDAAILLGR